MQLNLNHLEMYDDPSLTEPCAYQVEFVILRSLIWFGNPTFLSPAFFTKVDPFVMTSLQFWHVEEINISNDRVFRFLTSRLNVQTRHVHLDLFGNLGFWFTCSHHPLESTFLDLHILINFELFSKAVTKHPWSSHHASGHWYHFFMRVSGMVRVLSTEGSALGRLYR